MTTPAAIAAITLLAGAAFAQCPSTETDKLTDPDGDNAFDRFGSAVALSGNSLAVGEEGANRVHFFRYTSGAWSRVSVESGAAPNVEFLGTCVAMTEDAQGDKIALVGAGVDSDYCADPNDCATGAAVLYREVQGVWEVEEKLSRPFYLDSFNQFGLTVALSEDTAMVAASESVNGVVVPWEFDGHGWDRLDPMEASDGEEGDSFGRSIDIHWSGTRCVIGAPGDDDDGPQSGSAYIFERISGVWTETARLTPDDARGSAFFGAAAAFVGDLVAVGAPGPYGSEPGAVYVFELSDGVWTQRAKLVPSDGQTGHAFGTRVSAAGTDALVASSLRDDHAGSSAGSAYLFALADGSWSELGKLTASDAASDQAFGIGLDAEAGRAVVGAYEAFNGGGGAVYVFDGIDGCACPADFNGDGVVNTQDVLAFLNAWTSNDPSADFNADGDVNTLDVLAFLNAWTVGC